MAHLDDFQTSVVGAPDDSPSSSLAFPSPSLDTSRSDSERLHSLASPTDNHGHPSCPTLILRSARNSLDTFGYPSHGSDSSHPSCDSVRRAIESRDNKHHIFRRKRGNRDAKYNLLTSLHSAHSDVTSTLSSPGSQTFTWKVQSQSRPSAVTSFFRRTVRRVGRSPSSPNPGGETGSDPTRNDGQKREDQKQKSAVLDNLEERLNAANKLHGDIVTLHMLYESGTVATMRDLRAGKQ